MKVRTGENKTDGIKVENKTVEGFAAKAAGGGPV